MSRIFLVMLVTTAALTTAHAQQMPAWVRPYLDQDTSQAPEDAEVWRLLDKTTISLRSDGKFDQTRRIVQVILEESGAVDGSYFVMSGYERGVKIKKLKGFHLTPGKKVETLEKDNIVTSGLSDSEQITTGTMTIAAMDGVTRGSIVAFESREIRETFFSQSVYSLISDVPVKERIIELEAKGGKQIVLTPVNFEGWGLTSERTNGSLVIRNIPGSENEALTPGFIDPWPFVLAGFSDGSGDRLASWDNMAKWYLELFRTSAGLTGKGAPATDAATLRETVSWFEEKITYRQRYLSAARGWTPESGQEVARRAYGDCKDMVSCLAWRGAEKGFAVYPVLANIGQGSRIGGDAPVQVNFNHLIGALELAESLGLPAEVEAAGKRFLLFDPTSKYTPFGHLPAHYYGRNVMICTEEGAGWVAVPESSLEDAGTELILRGRLDSRFTLSGTFEMVETGDDNFLRTIFRSGNDRDLMRAFRETFEIPGVVDLTRVSSEIDDQQRLRLIYQVSWPSFFRRDAGGLRLPWAISGYRLRKLKLPGKERQAPIFISRRSPMKRVLEISSEVALRPGVASSAGSAEHHSYNWEAAGGNMLKINFSKQSDQVWFDRDALDEGLAYWDGWRSKYNKFWLEAMLFYPQ